MQRGSLTAMGVATCVGIVTVSLVVGDELGEWLREEFAKLSPSRLLVVVATIGLAVAVISFARAAGVSWPRATALAHRLRLRLIGIPAGVALPIVVGLAAAVRISLSYASAMPRVFADELIFADLAKSFAEHGSLTLRGVEDNGHSVLYPIAISPAYALANDGVAAFHSVQVFNSVAMALTAIPAYYLARRVLTHGWSLGIALLSVLVPATAYSALVMTESLFYPGFVTAALALTVTLERPTLTRQLLTAGLLLALVGVRTQALALLPAVVTAVVIDGVRSSTLRSRLRAFWPTWAVLAVLAVLALIASQVGPEAPTGAYGSLLRAYNPVEVVKWAVWNVAGYELSVGVAAFAALPLALVGLLRRGASDSERALGATTLSLGVWLLASVAVLSASPYGLEILHERSLFFFTPLLLVCFVYWLSAQLPRPLHLSLAIAAVVVAIVAVLPSRLFMSGATVDAPTNVLWQGLRERLTDVPAEWFVIGAAIVGTAVFLRSRTAVLPILTFAVTLLFINANSVSTSPISHEETKRLAWIDDALPTGKHAAIVHVAVDSTRCPRGTESYQGAAVAWTEFFNKSVDRVYGALGQVGDDGLATPQVTIDRNGTIMNGDRALEPEYAAVDSRVRIVGTELAKLDLHDFPGFDTTKPGSLTLWRPEQPLRLVFPGPLLAGRPEDIACPGQASQ